MEPTQLVKLLEYFWKKMQSKWVSKGNILFLFVMAAPRQEIKKNSWYISNSVRPIEKNVLLHIGFF